MRKYLRYAASLALAAGALGMGLMAWLFSAETDERGLYPANHPAWILLGMLTVAVLVLFWLLSRQAGTNRNYRQNFPSSIPAALGCVAAGIGLLSGGLNTLESGKSLGLITGLLGIAGSLLLFWAAVCRFRGQRSKLPVHMLPCFFFALQLFVLGQEFGSEPEMYRYLYRFWATAAMVPACYCLWSFDVKLGKRPDCLFWCLAAAYCNLTATADSAQRLMHLCMGIWMLTALPRLRYLPKPQKSAPESAALEVESQEEAVLPATEAVAEEEILPSTDDAWIQENTQSAADPLAVELPDTNAILEELLRDFGQQETP